MMNITKTQRQEAFSNANQLQIKFYGDPEYGSMLYAIARNHESTTNKYSDFAVAVGDVILGLVPQTQLPQLLVERLEIDQATANKVTGDLLDFLAPLDDPSAPAQSAATSIPIINNDRPIDTGLNQADVTAAPATAAESLEEEIAATEAAFHQLQPIRTMAHDMQSLRQDNEPSHKAASQEELLDKSDKRLSTTQ